MELKAAIFDFDGTLADTVPVVCTAFQKALKQYTGRDFSDQEIISRFGPSETGIIRSIVPDCWEECYQLYLKTYEEEHHRCESVFPGIMELLEKLKSFGVRLGIVTGKGPDSNALTVKRLGLERLFDRIIPGSPNGGVKPQAIKKLLEEWNCPPEAAVYVGDAVSDIEAAREAKVGALAAAWSDHIDFDELEAACPDAAFRTVDEMSAWFEQRLRNGGK